MAKQGNMQVQESSATNASSQTDTMPGFALYAVGIFVWMTFVSCCGATYALPFTPPHAETAPYVLAQQGAYVLTFFVVAATAGRKPANKALFESLWRLTAASFIGFLACLTFYEVGLRPSWLISLYGMFLGVGMTLGYIQWTALIAARPQNEIVKLLLIASLGSIASGIVLCLAPASIRILLAAIVFMPASLILLRANHARYEANAGNARSQAQQNKPQTATGNSTTSSTSSLATQLLPSIICAVVLSLAAPIVSTAYMEFITGELTRNLIAQGANLLAVITLGAFMLLGKRRLTITDAYRAMLPIMASAVLLGAFFQPSERWFVLFFSEACFCIVSLLILLESCAISREFKASPILVYGILGGFVYLARTPEVLFSLESPSFVENLSPIITALLLYLFAIPSFVLPLFSRTQKSSSNNENVAPSEQPIINADTDTVCALLAKENGLTPRQADVMRLLVKGVSIQRIAETLGLSDSTVATYRKAIYAALDVHARQELLDLVETQVHMRY